MPNFSNIVITGHLGRDPETRTMPSSGNTVTGFSVAVKTGYGERETTTWYNVSVFGKRGETAAEHFTKGSAITVTGELSLREYEKDGVTRSSLDINARDWAFAGGKGEAQSAPKPQRSVPATDGFEDSEIPF